MKPRACHWSRAGPGGGYGAVSLSVQSSPVPEEVRANEQNAVPGGVALDSEGGCSPGTRVRRPSYAFELPRQLFEPVSPWAPTQIHEGSACGPGSKAQAAQSQTVQGRVI